MTPVFIGFLDTLMDPPAGLRGFRKRWASGSADGDSQPAATEHASGDQVEPQSLELTGFDLFGSLETHETACEYSPSLAPSPSEPVQPDPVEVQDSASDSSVPAISSHVEQLGISTAFRLLRSRDIKMPWEKGPLSPLFTKKISGEAATSVKPCRVGLRDVLVPAPKIQVIAPKLPVSSFSAINRRIAKCRIHVAEDELRTKALNQFKVLISLDLDATQLGQSVTNVLGTIDPSVDPLQVLQDAMSNKATGTLLKRASSMWRFACWLEAGQMGTCFNQTEQVLYDYMNYLRDTGSAATSASHFVESLRFCNQMFKLQKMDIASVLSPRVTGASHSMFLKKRKLTQAPALPVKAVQTFEQICIYSADMHKRVIAGALLFCIFACVRWFDAMRIEELSADTHGNIVILEAATALHKTSMSKESKTRLLPYTAIGTFLDEQSWGLAFIDARVASGLNDQSVFLPSWNEVGSNWSNHPMSSGECTCWIREFLEDTFNGGSTEYSSHGCKATLLTWAGMTTLFSREERTLLGHHIEPQTRSNVTYSRDSQILLQYKVSKLIQMIDTGRLQPDVSRAQRLSTMLQDDANAQADLIEQQDDQPVELVRSDDSDDHYADEDAPLFSMRPVSKGGRDPVPEGAELNKWFIHSYTGMLHGMMPGHDTLACGRKITVNLAEIELDQIDIDAASMCIQCNTVIKRDAHAEASDR
jgi:hypothetical protein